MVWLTAADINKKLVFGSYRGTAALAMAPVLATAFALGVLASVALAVRPNMRNGYSFLQPEPILIKSSYT